MTKAELGTVICKVFGLYFFVCVLQTALSNWILIFSAPQAAENTFALYHYLSQFIVCGVLAALFWFCAEKIGRRLAGAQPENLAALSIGAGEIMCCVFAGFGLYLFSLSLPAGAELLSALLYRGPVSFRENYEALQLIKVILYLSFSFYFLFGSAGLLRLVLKLRGCDEG